MYEKVVAAQGSSDGRVSLLPGATSPPYKRGLRADHLKHTRLAVAFAR